MVVCVALGVDDCLEGVPARPYISGGDRVTWKVQAEYSWNPTTTQSSSPTPIRVVTKEVRYIHVLFLTLEHSISISSPAVPGLTVPEGGDDKQSAETPAGKLVVPCRKGILLFALSVIK